MVLLVLILAGCQAMEEPPVEGASVSGPLKESAAGERRIFSIQDSGQGIGIDFRGAVAQGKLHARLWDATGKVVWEHEAGVGMFNVNTVVNPPQKGTYELGLAWDGAVNAQYSLKWQPGQVPVPTVSPLALLGGVGMILVAGAFIVYALWRRLGAGYLGLGALAWVVTVVLKFVWAIPLNGPIYNALFNNMPRWLAGPVFWLYVGALTGVFEVALTWLVLRYSKLGQTTWERAFVFGIGFGAIEALLLGLSSLTSVLAGMLSPAAMPYETLVALARANNPLWGFAPIVERIATTFVHIFSNVLLFYGVRTRQSRWFWLAFAYKTLIDTVAAFAQLWGLTTLGRIWTIEAVIVLFGVVGWWGIRWVRSRYLNPQVE